MNKSKLYNVTQQEYEQRWDVILNRPTLEELDDQKAETEAFEQIEKNQKLNALKNTDK